MSLFLFIMEADYKKLITCIKELYDLITDQIRRTFSHVLYKMSVTASVSLPCKSYIFLQQKDHHFSFFLKYVTGTAILDVLSISTNVIKKKNNNKKQQQQRQSTCRILQGTTLVCQAQQCNLKHLNCPSPNSNDKIDQSSHKTCHHF